MSHKATNWAIEQRGLKPIAKVLLWRLADRHNPDYGCFPDQASLAHDCEISRASVNRYLNELEQRGLIRREQRIHPDTKKQMNTRYVLAFEDDFSTPDVVSRVSDSDTENEPGRVSKNDKAVSQKPGVPVSQSCETLTSKRTSNGSGKASARVSFDQILEAYPCRPMMNLTEASDAYAAIPDDQTPRVLVAAKRYFRWHLEDAETRNETPVAALEYRTGLGKWLRSGAWVAALTVPLKSDPVPACVEGWIYLPPDHPDFKAVERMLGKKLPIVSASGKRGFRVEEIEQARTAA